jgi:hypothetical protein
MAAETWQMDDPRRPHPDHPVVDDTSAEVLEAAIHQLTIARSPLNEGHAGLRLHVLASLIAQARALVPDAVADARERGFWWSEIAGELGITAGAARRRYADHVREWRRALPLDLD